MVKKALLIAAVMVVVVSATGFSLGLGLAFAPSFGDLPGNDVLFTAKLDQLPFLLGVAWDLEPFRIGATADWWLATGPLAGIINYYAGPGLFLGVGADFDFGLRIPIGLNIYPIDALELFLEIAPAIEFIPAFPDVGVQAAFGFRFWFN